jgi:hypothetical protein
LCTFYLKMVTKSGPKHVVVVHNKIEHEKHLLRTVVLIKVLMNWYDSLILSLYHTESILG